MTKSSGLQYTIIPRFVPLDIPLPSVNGKRWLADLKQDCKVEVQPGVSRVFVCLNQNDDSTLELHHLPAHLFILSLPEHEVHLRKNQFVLKELSL